VRTWPTYMSRERKYNIGASRKKVKTERTMILDAYEGERTGGKSGDQGVTLPHGGGSLGTLCRGIWRNEYALFLKSDARR